jgi:hypothetical protein
MVSIARALRAADHCFELSLGEDEDDRAFDFVKETSQRSPTERWRPRRLARRASSPPNRQTLYIC